MSIGTGVMDPRTRQEQAISRIEARLENPPGWGEAAICEVCFIEVSDCTCFGMEVFADE